MIKDEQAVGSLAAEGERKEQEIEQLIEERQELLNHFASGQKLALVLAKNHHWREMKRGFMKIQQHIYDMEDEKYGQQIDETEAALIQLAEQHAEAKKRNENLQEENDILRKASEDGLAIARHVQEMTQEKEKLSEDLINHNKEITHLLSENNDLSKQIKEAMDIISQYEQNNQH